MLQKLTEARILKPMGSAFSRDGKFHLVEYTDESRAREQALFASILDAITAHCEVVPAYGPEQIPELLTKLEPVISHEEHAVLMAALEQGAALLTLDMRLRGMASLFKVQGCWPQEFLRSMTVDKLAPRDYSLAVLKMFCSRRDFISLNAGDLLVLTDQGPSYLNVGLNQLRELWSSLNCDFEAAWRVTSEYLHSLYMRGQCEAGAILELFMYLVEARLRHPKCPKRFSECAATELGRKLGNEQDRYTPYLREFARLAAGRLKSPMRPISVRASVIYCSNPPSIRHGLSQSSNPFEEVAKEPPSLEPPQASEQTTLCLPVSNSVLSKQDCFLRTTRAVPPPTLTRQ